MNNVVFLDCAVIVTLIVVAYLSKRLGEALKTPPFYILFYCAVILVGIAALFNGFIARILSVEINTFFNTLFMTLRFICGIVAVFTCMQYWKWLFSEFFKG